MSENKITLITPPDFYENGNYSILFIGITEDQQAQASKWLYDNIADLPPLNVYFYQDEVNIEWLLYATSRSNIRVINFDADSSIIQYMGIYISSKPGTYFMTDYENMKSLVGYINNQYVPTIQDFLKKAADDSKK